MPGYGVFARHVKDLELSRIKLFPAKDEARPAIVCVDVDGLEIDTFKAPVIEGIKMARFEKVSNDEIRYSPALEKEGAIDRKSEISAASPEEPKAPKKPKNGAAAAAPAAPATE